MMTCKGITGYGNDRFLKVILVGVLRTRLMDTSAKPLWSLLANLILLLLVQSHGEGATDLKTIKDTNQQTLAQTIGVGVITVEGSEGHAGQPQSARRPCGRAARATAVAEA
jgi:hypothetical protein